MFVIYYMLEETYSESITSIHCPQVLCNKMLWYEALLDGASLLGDLKRIKKQKAIISCKGYLNSLRIIVSFDFVLKHLVVNRTFLQKLSLNVFTIAP